LLAFAFAAQLTANTQTRLVIDNIKGVSHRLEDLIYYFPPPRQLDIMQIHEVIEECAKALAERSRSELSQKGIDNRVEFLRVGFMALHQTSQLWTQPLTGSACKNIMEYLRPLQLIQEEEDGAKTELSQACLYGLVHTLTGLGLGDK
jgi:hypothetical protein